MSHMRVSIVCCDDSPEKFSHVVETAIQHGDWEDMVISTELQEIPPGTTREFHNAAHHPEHGPVTYFQEVHEGGFSVGTGDPAKPQETFFGPGSWVAFTDDQGPGHSSQVGPSGVKRTLRVLKGLLQPSE